MLHALYMLKPDFPIKHGRLKTLLAPGKKGHKFIRSERMGDDTTADESYHQYFGICKVNGGKESVIDKRMLKLQCCLHQGEINKQAG